MSSLCQSARQIQDESQQQINVKKHRRIRSHHHHNPENSPRHIPLSNGIQMYHYESAMSSREANNRGKNKGLQLTRHNTEKVEKKQGRSFECGVQETHKSMFQEIRPPQSTKAVSNLVSQMFFEDVLSKRSQQIPKAHHPHPLISRRQHQILASPRALKVEQQSYLSFKAKPANKPNISIINPPKKQEIKINIKIPAQMTRNSSKKEQQDARQSQQTASNRNSSNLGNKEGYNLKKAQIFDTSTYKAPINQLERKISELNITNSPKRLLEDAKSIVSRQEELSRLDDFLFDESILVEHDIDVFTDIVHMETKSHHLAKAVDKRTGEAVTLKYFSEAQQKQYHQELELIQLSEGLGNQLFPLKILKFHSSFINDHSNNKQIIFVYEPFFSNLAQFLSSMKVQNLPVEPYIDKIITELRTTLQILAINGIILTELLTVEDLLNVDKDWRLHSLSKFKLDMRKANKVDELWLQKLREELRRLI